MKNRAFSSLMTYQYIFSSYILAHPKFLIIFCTAATTVRLGQVWFNFKILEQMLKTETEAFELI